jgi:FkbM family methyltransferase
MKVVGANVFFKKIIKKILSVAIKKYRLPWLEGFISIYDQIADQSIELFWREDSFMESEFYRYGLYGGWEKQSLKVWAYLAKRSKNILDIGANTGIYSIIAKNNNSDASVFAVEPISINFEILKKNIQKNNFLINAEDVALADYDGTAKMYMLKDRLNYMTSIDDNRYALHPEVGGKCDIIETIVSVKKYSYLQHKYTIKNIDLIKIDVEGHELAVLRSLYSELEVNRPTMIIEIISDESANEINELLSPLQYSYFSIDEINETLTLVSKLWNNNHQNFLVCTQEVIVYLKSLNIL